MEYSQQRSLKAHLLVSKKCKIVQIGVRLLVFHLPPPPPLKKKKKKKQKTNKQTNKQKNKQQRQTNKQTKFSLRQ